MSKGVKKGKKRKEKSKKKKIEMIFCK